MWKLPRLSTQRNGSLAQHTVVVKHSSVVAQDSGAARNHTTRHDATGDIKNDGVARTPRTLARMHVCKRACVRAV